MSVSALVTASKRKKSSIPTPFGTLLGLIRKGCKQADILRWLAENLSIDYTLKNNAYQFRRAWEDHGRFTPEIRLEVELLKDMVGVHTLLSSARG